ncbi:transposase [Pseudomonas sp. IT-P294]
MLNRRQNPLPLMTCHHRYPVRGVNICDYFFLQGLVTWLDTSILSRTIQEVIDARQLV